MVVTKNIRFALFVTVFALTGIGCLFLSFPAFVNNQVTPKWYALIFGAHAWVLLYIVYRAFSNRMRLRKVIPVIYFTVAGLCTLQALYGIFQYAGIFHSSNGFRVTGSFDNPAGFAASLCAGFPCMLYFFRSKQNLVKYLAYLAMAINVLAISFSASRAGFISLAVVIIARLYYTDFFNTGSIKKVLLLILVLLSLSGLYFLKKDSADGRLLIWRCSWEMVKDKPVFGFGHGGFKANYMNYQAKYFEEHPDSKCVMLADNVNRPFNEYLLLLINYGFEGLIQFLIVVWLLWKSYRRCDKNNWLVRTAVLSLLSIAGFAFFSYPLTYPFVWSVGILSIVVILCHAKYTIVIPSIVVRVLALAGLPLVIISGRYVYQQMCNEMNWCTIAHKSLAGQTEEMLPAYKLLHSSMSNNELFLYNYAMELNVAKHYYYESLQIAQECEKLLVDYDLQMLMADNYMQLERYEEAEKHYRKAAFMCPVKFIPLYKLFQLYEVTGNTENARKIAKTIIEKPVKIMSPIIVNIKQEVKRKIECL